MRIKFKESIIFGVFVLFAFLSLLFGERITFASESVGFSEKGILKEEWRYDMHWYSWGWFGSSPAILDLGSDVNKKGNEPDSDLEIITGSDEYCNYYPELGEYACGIWRVFDSKGNIEWAKDTETDEARSSPTVIDLDGDGNPEIIGGTTSGYYLEVMDHLGSDNFVWTFPKLPGYHTGGPFVWPSSPAVADIDKSIDGLEIVIGNRVDGKVYAFDGANNNGKDDGITIGSLPWFPYPIGEEGKDWDVLWTFEPPEGIGENGIVSTPAIADVDKDGKLEVVVGSTNGNVYVLNASDGKLEYTFKTNSPVYSSPALANIDADKYLEIIIGSTDKNIYCFQWNGKTGKTKWKYSTQGAIYSSPAIEDINEDGKFEIVIGSNDGRVYALSVSGTLEWSYSTGGAVYSSPVIANRGKDFGFDIYVGSDDGYLYLLDGKTGNKIDRFRVYRSWFGGIHTSPSVADIDGDNKLEIIFYDWGQGSVYGGHTFWVLEDTQSQADKHSIEWGMFRRNPSRTGSKEEWSFAIITDLHIGRGYPDYGTETFKDDIDDGDYYLTERLRNVVKWINKHKDDIDCGGTKCPIKFVGVLGDIADSAERSEFKKTEKILDKLNDPNGDGNTSDGIPYVPVFGNHDVWPYTDFEEATSTLGENYFDEIFWDENATNTKLIKQRLNWQRDENNPNYKNFAFSYGGINFIGLDFVSRKPFPGPPKGVEATSDIYDPTLRWFAQYLKEKASTIIFSHHPFIMDLLNAFWPDEMSTLDETIKISKANVLADFAGHIHSFEEFWGKWPENANIEYPTGIHWYTPADIPVVTTEALMVGSNGKGGDKKGIIRIVKVNNPKELKEENYNNWETTETGDEFVALNPDFNYRISKTDEEGDPEEYTFLAKSFTEREILNYEWKIFDQFFGLILKRSGKEWKKLPIPESMLIGSPQIWVKLTLRDQRTGQIESIFKKQIISSAPAFPILAPVNNQTISLSTGQDLKKFPENREKIKVQINQITSEPKPVGTLTVNFNQATSNIDLTNLIAQTDLENRKSVLYMPKWPEVVEESKVLFIPSTGVGKVYICPKATSLEDVNPNCENKTILNLGETKNGMTLSLTEYEGMEYYLVYGITGTGGGEAEKKEVKLEEQIAITKMEYGEIDILATTTQQIGDGKSPLLLSELKGVTIDLEDFTFEGEIKPNEKRRLKMKFKFLESAGNEYQGKSINVKFKFKATQEEQ